MSNVVIKKEDGEDEIPTQTNGNSNSRSNRNQAMKSEDQQSQTSSQTKKKVTYKDYPIYSSTPTDSLFHIMRFDSHLRVDPSSTSQFIRPLKLNRKREPRLKQKEAKGGDLVLDRWGKQLLEEGKPMVWPRDQKEFKKIEAQLKAIDDRK